MYINKLDEIVNKCNNTYHSPVKMKSSAYIDFGKENNNKDPKFKVGDHVRISKYKNIFAKGYVDNWSQEVLKRLVKIFLKSTVKI